MKVFVSYAFTGEDHTVLRKRLSDLRETFLQLGVDFYINIFSPDWQSMMDNNATGGEFMQSALKDMRPCDIVLALQASERRSEGMLMEIGAAIALGKKVVLAQHQSCIGKTYLPTMANDTFVWHDEQELIRQVREYFNDKN